MAATLNSAPRTTLGSQSGDDIEEGVMESVTQYKEEILIRADLPS